MSWKMYESVLVGTLNKKAKGGKGQCVKRGVYK